jgi:hypothetical protein
VLRLEMTRNPIHTRCFTENFRVLRFAPGTGCEASVSSSLALVLQRRAMARPASRVLLEVFVVHQNNNNNIIIILIITQ